MQRHMIDSSNFSKVHGDVIYLDEMACRIQVFSHFKRVFPPHPNPDKLEIRSTFDGSTEFTEG